MYEHYRARRVQRRPFFLSLLVFVSAAVLAFFFVV